MMQWLSKRKKEKADAAVCRELIGRLNGRVIKYVTERDADNTDSVIGKEGSLSVRDGELIVLASQKIVFRCRTCALHASELLSLEGVILEGPDDENESRQRKIIAYYKYYR